MSKPTNPDSSSQPTPKNTSTRKSQKLTKSGEIDRRTNRKPRKLDVKKVMELKAAGMSNPDIAIHQGVHRSAVWKFLDKSNSEYQDFQTLRDHSADIHLYDRYKTRQERMRVTNLMETTPDNEIRELGYDKMAGVTKVLKVNEGISETKEVDAREGRPVMQNFFQINLNVEQAREQQDAAQRELDES